MFVIASMKMAANSGDWQRTVGQGIGHPQRGGWCGAPMDLADGMPGAFDDTEELCGWHLLRVTVDLGTGRVASSIVYL